MHCSLSPLFAFGLAVLSASCTDVAGEQGPTMDSNGDAQLGEVSAGGQNTGATSSGGGSDVDLTHVSGGNGSLSGSSGGGALSTSGEDELCGGVFAGLESCGSSVKKAEIVPANVLLVIDKSGSMADIPNGEENSMWKSTNLALRNTLRTASDAVSFGLQLFPASSVGAGCGASGTCCEMPEAGGVTVPIEAGFENRQAIVNQLDSTGPGGGTPAAVALAQAFEYFSVGAGKQLQGDRFVLFFTDGGPNCNSGLSCAAEACTANIDVAKNPECAGVNCCEGNNEECLDDSGTIERIVSLNAIGVGTFVVGLSGSELYASQLNEFAIAGGHPRKDAEQSYFKVNAEGSAQGLSEVLLEITENLLQTCTLQLGWKTQVSLLNVAVDCTTIPRAAEDFEASDGDVLDDGSGGELSYWTLDEDAELPSVHLHGAICTKIETEGVRRIDVLSDCPTIVIR
jgi:hypothetical protein